MIWTFWHTRAWPIFSRARFTPSAADATTTLVLSCQAVLAQKEPFKHASEMRLKLLKALALLDGLLKKSNPRTMVTSTTNLSWHITKRNWGSKTEQEEQFAMEKTWEKESNWTVSCFYLHWRLNTVSVFQRISHLSLFAHFADCILQPRHGAQTRWGHSGVQKMSFEVFLLFFFPQSCGNLECSVSIPVRNIKPHCPGKWKCIDSDWACVYRTIKMNQVKVKV